MGCKIVILLRIIKIIFCLGIVYITYEKISDAARAMEEMNGKSIPGNSKPLKV